MNTELKFPSFILSKVLLIPTSSFSSDIILFSASSFCRPLSVVMKSENAVIFALFQWSVLFTS
jgi:hypothetical protein